MKDLAMMIDELRECGQLILDISSSLERAFTSQDSQAKPEPEQFTLEQVRSILADKARQGFTAQIRELLESHGASRLSEVNPTEYAMLLKEVEVLENE